jgi:triphosphatase
VSALARVVRPRTLALPPNDNLAAAARAVIGFHLQALRREQQNAFGGETEPLHEMRVATRRMRAALRLFSSLMPPAAYDALRHELAWLGRAIGAVRDLDVIAGVIANRAQRLDPQMRMALRPIEHAIRERRAAALAALAELSDSPRQRALVSRLDGAFGAAGRESTLGLVAPELIAPLLRSVLRAGRKIDRDSPAQALHRLRVRTKRLRYALEIMQGYSGKSVGRALDRLTKLQLVLGNHQDAVMTVVWLRTFAETSNTPATTLLAAGALIHSLEKRMRKMRGRLPAAWKALDCKSIQRKLLADITRHGQSAPVRKLTLIRASAS